MHPLRLLTIATVITALAACGGGDDASTSDGSTGADRTVEINMVDIAFEPDTLEVSRGETVRFVFTNRGTAPHDAFIGDADAQAEHEAEMRESDDDHNGHDGDADAITVEPGATGELTHTFEERGTVEIGCHQPGHYEAGMTIEVAVV